MGVYIEGMEMPKTCRECSYCWAGLKSCDAKYGLPVGDRWDMERASFCPLTEVPEPHGRLIDADALKKDLDTIWFVDRGNCSDVQSCVADAPTVIERSNK